jgi:hypothetical protein
MTEEAPRPTTYQEPIEVHLADVNGWLRRLSSRYGADITTSPVTPQIYPPPARIEPDTYGDRTGTWGDGVEWLEYWAHLGTGWVNLGIAEDTNGHPYIVYESQWRKGDDWPPLIVPRARWPRAVARPDAPSGPIHMGQ